MIDPGRRVVLVTGCSTGIGRALAEVFLAEGHRVVATARQTATLDALAGDRTLIRHLDVTDPVSIEAAVADAVSWAGRIDILVNNAGYALIGPVAELDDGDLGRQLDTNVIGMVRAVRAVVPHMAARGSGCIVNIGSVSGLLATPFGGAYSASKAALHLLSDALRSEVAPFGIDVVVIRAGAVASNFPDAAGRGLERYRDPGSLYRSQVSGMEERARMSENLSMPAASFARRVVREVTRDNPPAVVKIGGGARMVPVAALLPKKLLARMLGRKFGLA
jgi:NAD(P)-dependent dehydrogenase (short-subunit alcohol dehydrogenase family)